ncbi:MAG: ATP-dependent DNA helicase RecG [Epulopiscium sp. Nuni2H_MBin003]|nr:MAG: ATP-dependent DNA helicase RecG [Epulopiscium sp. Nuni2H_MBin003]
MIDESIQILKGVGAQTSAKFTKLNIFTIKDLIEHFPRNHEDHQNIMPISNIKIDKHNSILARVISTPQLTKKGSLIITTFKVTDDTGTLSIIFFNQPYTRSNFHVGEVYNFYGIVNNKYNTIQMSSPSYKTLSQYNNMPKIVPIYPSTKLLSQTLIRNYIQQALDLVKDEMDEVLPEEIILKYNFLSKKEAICNVHFPTSYDVFMQARHRLIFEELFILQLSLYLLKSDFKVKNQGTVKNIPDDLMCFIDKLPFSLTTAQKRVTNEIIADMQKEEAANRLIQGDVGSGKTVIAAISLFITIRNNFQAALMAPTEVLATQHFKFLNEIFKDFNITIKLLTGSTSKKNKQILLDSLQAGEIDILVGTHALLEDNVVYNNLGLAITDEQHRFGVRQRLKLSQKGISPDILAMTATPIPRTLGLILYGDMDISIIDELPPGRTPIKTNAVNSSYYPRIYNFIRQHIDKGRQCYIICPMVTENEKTDDLKDVISYTKQLASNEFSQYNIEYLHGKMKGREKNDVMTRFANGDIDILVSTTVVEVGVNVPNATIMIIENAERFGLSQLHQLRGRVGRGIHESFCILISDSYNSDTKARLKVMTDTTDGFVIADMDLKLRGSGDFFGTKQHGLPEMKIANIYVHTDILQMVQREVENIMKTKQTRYAELFEYIREKYKYTNPTL